MGSSLLWWRDKISEVGTTHFGISQGSVFGPPTVLNLYINDRERAIDRSRVAMCTGGTSIIFNSDDMDTLGFTYTVNMDLLRRSCWFSANKLTLNIDKAIHVLFRRLQKKVPHNIRIKLCSNNLVRVVETSFLCVLLNEYLSY